MDPEQLQDLVKRTDPDSMGAELEKKKEEALKSAQESAEQEERYQEKRQERVSKRVGIKTYRDYAAEQLKSGGGTLTGMILKEREREREERRHAPTNPRNVIVLALAAIIVCVAIGVVAFSFIVVSNKADDVAIKNSFIVAAQPLLFSDFRQEIYIPNPTSSRLERAVAQDIEQTAIPIGKVKHVYFVQDGDLAPKELVPAPAFIREISNTIPPELIRQINPLFMYGYYSSRENAPFFIFTIRDYGRAYASMLDWERTMVGEFAPYFTQELNAFNATFQDLVLFNIDTRVILDQRGDVIFGYAFLQDRETLVIFDSRLTLEEINTRNLRNPVLR